MSEDIKILTEKLTKAEAETLRVKEYYSNNLTKLMGKAASDLERVSGLIIAANACHMNIKRQLDELKNGNGPSSDIAIESISFFTAKAHELTKRAIDICENKHTATLMPVVAGVDDYVFNEFTFNSVSRVVTVNNRQVNIPQSEFVYLLELVKNPNMEVHFDNPENARTIISRIKHRVVELKTLIKPVFGKSSYTLHVTPITTK